VLIQYPYVGLVLGIFALAGAVWLTERGSSLLMRSIASGRGPFSSRACCPAAPILDDMAYRSVMAGFPAMALVIILRCLSAGLADTTSGILGALWANTALSRYWGWDPKETASLVTLFIYGAYLHARVVRGWQGQRSATLLLLGFAAVLFTYFGNLFFGGLHSYVGLG